MKVFLWTLCTTNHLCILYILPGKNEIEWYWTLDPSSLTGRELNCQLVPFSVVVNIAVAMAISVKWHDT